MGIKGIAEIDGKQVEVELVEVKDLDGHFTKEQADERINRAIKDRLKNHKTPEQLMEDEDFVTQLFEKRGIDPKAKGKKLDPEEIEALQRNWREKELTPAQQKAQEAEARAAKLLDRRKVAELANALIDAGVKKAVAGKLARMHADQFGFDEERDAFALLGEDGEFAMSERPSKGKPFKDLAEFAAEWAADPENAEFVEKRQQSGPNLGGSRGGKAVTITRSEARNFRAFQAAEKRAAEAGVPLQIIDDN